MKPLCWLVYSLCLVTALLTGCQLRTRLSPVLTPPPQGTLQLTFFDVGQGDAALVQFPNGKTMLIDGGPSESAPTGYPRKNVQSLISKLRALKVARIDYLVASHPHSDHIGGFVRLLKEIPVQEVWDSGFVYDSPVYLDYLQAVKRSGAKFRTIGKGYKASPASNCQIEVFAPSKPFLRGTQSDANNASIVMRLRFGKVRVLFTGDIEREGRARIYKQGADLRAEILKVSHHGSKNGTDLAFLNRVRPRIAVISCGLGNLYGHPHKEALQALRKVGATIYRTDLQGDILVRIQGDQVQVFTTRKATPVPALESAEGSFIGNRVSKVYHAPDCKGLPKPENRVYFRSREEAEQAGYRPHRACIGQR